MRIEASLHQLLGSLSTKKLSLIEPRKTKKLGSKQCSYKIAFIERTGDGPETGHQIDDCQRPAEWHG